MSEEFDQEAPETTRKSARALDRSSRCSALPQAADVYRLVCTSLRLGRPAAAAIGRSPLVRLGPYRAW